MFKLYFLTVWLHLWTTSCDLFSYSEIIIFSLATNSTGKSNAPTVKCILWYWTTCG